MLTAHCPSCHHAFDVPESLAGQVTICPACSEKFRVRGIGAPRKPFGRRRGAPSALLFAAGVLLTSCVAGALAWALRPPGPAPAIPSQRNDLALAKPASLPTSRPAAPSPAAGPDTAALERERQAALNAKKKRQEEAAERERQRKWNLEWDALGPLDKLTILDLRKRLALPMPALKVDGGWEQYVLDHWTFFDDDACRAGFVKIADAAGFEEFRKNLRWPEGDYLRERAVAFLFAPLPRPMPGGRRRGSSYALAISRHIRDRGWDNADPGVKKYVRDNDDLFKPPPSR